MRASRRWISRVAACAACGLATGCAQYQRDERAVVLARAGDFGKARASALNRATDDRADRSYMLDRMKVLSMALADGLPDAARPAADEVYGFLRTQGVNAEKTLPSVFFGEGATRVYKGEPFEQAMALAQVAALDATMGDWGNARAAAQSALFQVRDFTKTLPPGAPGADTGGERMALVERAGDDTTGAFERLATAAPSDFELGYALRAVAARQLGEAADMEEAVVQMVRVAPRLEPLAGTIRAGGYNTVLLVESGTGPQKIATGPDGAIATFRRTAPGSDAPLRVEVGGMRAEFPVATDTDRLAFDLRWSNLEDLRLAKSAMGDGLLLAGAAVASSSKKKEAQWAGLGLLLAGAMAKGTAQADTRHHELLPQRTHLALLTLREAGPIHLEIDGPAPTRLTLAGLTPPPSGGLLFRLVRMPAEAAAWAESGAVLYANDVAPVDPGTPDASLPYILGGRCVRTPNEAVLSDYQRAGHLIGLTLDDLIDVYKEEGIEIVGLSRDPNVGRHVLEGGRFLYSPVAGTTGFARLYGQVHAAYRPTSARVRALAADIRSARAAPRAQPGPTGATLVPSR